MTTMATLLQSTSPSRAPAQLSGFMILEKWKQKTGAVAPALFGAVKLLVNNWSRDF
jgi:hypothetical protein